MAVHGVLDMDSRQQWVHEGHGVAVKRHWEQLFDGRVGTGFVDDYFQSLCCQLL